MRKLIVIIRQAVKSVLLHKLRSGLTMLGIVFGVFSVIAMLAIGEGASAYAQEQVLKLGATNIIVRTVKPPRDQNQGGGDSFVLQYGLLRSDYKLLTRTIAAVTGAIPIREASQTVRYRHRSLNGRLVGCTPEYKRLNRLSLARGRFISDEDNHDMANVAVIASEVATRLFPHEDPKGKTIRVGSLRFTIVGIMQERTASAAIGGSLSAQDYNKDVYIPIRTFHVRIGDTIIRRQQGSFTGERVELNQITLRVEDRSDVLPVADVVRESLQKTHGEKRDYAIVVPLELLEQAGQIRLIFNFVLGSIAAISLVVGGIGIMNIMLASVTERTREIGLRRALGARQKDIIQQFLAETVMLSATGGILGIVLGLLTPVAFEGIKAVVENIVFEGGEAATSFGRMFSNMHPEVAPWSLPLAFGISVGVGIIFGLYPARSAARLDPIEALRHE